MDKYLLHEHLKLADRHITLGRMHLDKQRQLIQKLGEDGHDTSIARSFLHVLLASLNLHLSDRRRLQKALAREKREQYLRRMGWL